MRRFAADLHIHTALSPCALEEMTPPAIVRRATLKGLAMIAICDHNSADNVQAVQQAAEGALCVIAGIEIATAEEVHVLGLFPDALAACDAGDEVRATLPDRTTGDRFGDQMLFDAAGVGLGEETKMLSAASGFDLTGAVGLIHQHGGLAIAAHVDRPSFGVISQLGMLPADVPFDAIEISAAAAGSGRWIEFAGCELPVVTGSDSHSLAEMGCVRTMLTMDEPSFAELTRALAGVGGRRADRA